MVKQFITNNHITISHIEQFARRSNEITNSIVTRAVINKRLTINLIDATREFLKIYDRTIEPATEFNTELAKA